VWTDRLTSPSLKYRKKIVAEKTPANERYNNNKILKNRKLTNEIF
jgi:hypothetical protein